ncbi:hypothetical protein ACTA71_003173 [Dictyostelium dimigraforme]
MLITTFTNTFSKQQLNIIQVTGNLILTPLSVANQLADSNLLLKIHSDQIENRMKTKSINFNFNFNQFNFTNCYQVEIEFTFTLNGINKDNNQISNSIKENLSTHISNSLVSSVFKPLNLNEPWF